MSVQPCARANPSENDSETNLRQLALDGQTMKNLRELVCEFELDPVWGTNLFSTRRRGRMRWVDKLNHFFHPMQALKPDI